MVSACSSIFTLQDQILEHWLPTSVMARISIHATRIENGSASADPRHVHTAVSSTVASWLVFTRYRSSSVPGTQPTPACRLAVPGACIRLAYIFPGFVFPGLFVKTPFSAVVVPQQQSIFPIRVYFSGFRLPWPICQNSFFGCCGATTTVDFSHQVDTKCSDRVACVV
jgi:hypothetical protein